MLNSPMIQDFMRLVGFFDLLSFGRFRVCALRMSVRDALTFGAFCNNSTILILIRFLRTIVKGIQTSLPLKPRQHPSTSMIPLSPLSTAFEIKMWEPPGHLSEMFPPLENWVVEWSLQQVWRWELHVSYSMW